MNTIFIQFYDPQFYGALDICTISNGFSNTFNFCKTKGDFIWVDRTKSNEFQFPFRKGTVYLSLMFSHDLNQAIEWASQNPDIKFIGGGPTITSRSFPKKDTRFIAPKNLALTDMTVEQLFHIDHDKKQWGLDLTTIQNINNYKGVYLCYSIADICYWNKCTFCPYQLIRKNYFKEDIDLSVLDNIKFNGIKIVKFSHPSMSKRYLDILFPQFYEDKNLIYDITARCDPSIYNSLKNHLNKLKKKNSSPKIRIGFGFEFPTDRMLKFMNKGITSKDAVQTLKILDNFDNVKVSGSFIIGWPYITKEDIKDLERFSRQVPKINAITIHRLRCQEGTQAYNIFLERKLKEEFIGNYSDGYDPYLTKEERKLNLEAAKIIASMSDNSYHQYEGRI